MASTRGIDTDALKNVHVHSLRARWERIIAGVKPRERSQSMNDLGEYFKNAGQTARVIQESVADLDKKATKPTPTLGRERAATQSPKPPTLKTNKSPSSEKKVSTPTSPRRLLRNINNLAGKAFSRKTPDKKKVSSPQNTKVQQAPPPKDDIPKKLENNIIEIRNLLVSIGGLVEIVENGLEVISQDERTPFFISKIKNSLLQTKNSVSERLSVLKEDVKRIPPPIARRSRSFSDLENCISNPELKKKSARERAITEAVLKVPAQGRERATTITQTPRRPLPQPPKKTSTPTTPRIRQLSPEKETDSPSPRCLRTRQHVFLKEENMVTLNHIKEARSLINALDSLIDDIEHDLKGIKTGDLTTPFLMQGEVSRLKNSLHDTKEEALVGYYEVRFSEHDKRLREFASKMVEFIEIITQLKKALDMGSVKIQRFDKSHISNAMEKFLATIEKEKLVNLLRDFNLNIQTNEGKTIETFKRMERFFKALRHLNESYIRHFAFNALNVTQNGNGCRVAFANRLGEKDEREATDLLMSIPRELTTYRSFLKDEKDDLCIRSQEVAKIILVECLPFPNGAIVSGFEHLKDKLITQMEKIQSHDSLFPLGQLHKKAPASPSTN